MAMPLIWVLKSLNVLNFFDFLTDFDQSYINMHDCKDLSSKIHSSTTLRFALISVVVLFFLFFLCVCPGPQIPI